MGDEGFALVLGIFIGLFFAFMVAATLEIGKGTPVTATLEEVSWRGEYPGKFLVSQDGVQKIASIDDYRDDECLFLKLGQELECKQRCNGRLTCSCNSPATVTEIIISVTIEEWRE